MNSALKRDSALWVVRVRYLPDFFWQIKLSTLLFVIMLLSFDISRGGGWRRGGSCIILT